jgi:hypothetical protein
MRAGDQRRLMTSSQRVHLMADLWPSACRCQGWAAKDRALRLQVLSEAVGRALSSANDLDSTGDYDRVKAHLGMLSDNVAATIETDHPQLGRARRLRAAIRRYLRDPRPFHPNPDDLLSKLIRDKFGRRVALDDLTADPVMRTDRRTGELLERTSELDQLVFTLSRILSTKRKEARVGQGGGESNEPF